MFPLRKKNLRPDRPVSCCAGGAEKRPGRAQECSRWALGC